MCLPATRTRSLLPETQIYAWSNGRERAGKYASMIRHSNGGMHLVFKRRKSIYIIYINMYIKPVNTRSLSIINPIREMQSKAMVRSE